MGKQNLTLINDDCIKVLKDLESESVDCIITSPPYYMGFEYESYLNSYYQYIEWCKIWLSECKRVLKTNGTFYLNLANSKDASIRAFELLHICTHELYFKLHDTIIWYKYNPIPVNTDKILLNQTEFLFMLRHNSNNVHLNKKLARDYNPHIFKTKLVGNVWEIPVNNKTFARKETKSTKKGHSGYPVELTDTCILLSTQRGDLVLDPFMGSGTTGVSCKKLNRSFIGVELEEEYFIIAKKRINETEKSLI